MQVVMIMLSNGGERRSFSVVRSTTTIGRREDCDLRIPVGDVSRKHCRLVLSPDNLRVQDLGSSNGTFVNGQQVQDAFLNAGDTVSVGPVNFIVQIDGVPAEDQFDAPVDAGTAAGGTALAVDALTAAGAAEPQPTDDLIGDFAPADEAAVDAAPTDEAAAEPAGDGLTLDELPVGSDQVAFDSVELDDGGEPPAAEVPAAAPAAEADDWDFLIEEPEADKSGADLHVDLDQSHGHQPPA